MEIQVGQFAHLPLRMCIEAWLDEPIYTTPDSPKRRDFPFDPEDSFSWAIREMQEISNALRDGVSK